MRHAVARLGTRVLALLVLTTFAAPSRVDARPLPVGEPTTGVAAAGATTDEATAPWRGSRITLRNAATALSFDESAELTYNPYYAIALGISPRWWFGDIFYVGADFAMLWEVTDADNTTDDRETQLGDVLIRLGAARFYTIPVVGIDLSAGLTLTTPTSKVSKARTLILGLTPSVGLARRFPVLEGLTLSYGFAAAKYFNRYTTMERERPLVATCLGDSVECGAFLHTGLRNPSWRLLNRFDVALDFLDWIGMRVGVGIVTDFLYPIEDRDERVSFEPQKGTDLRHTMVYDLELTFRPLRALEIGVGASTANPQLAPDSSQRAPFFNRYTEIYVDLRLDIAGLVSTFTSSEGTP